MRGRGGMRAGIDPAIARCSTRWNHDPGRKRRRRRRARRSSTARCRQTMVAGRTANHDHSQPDPTAASRRQRLPAHRHHPKVFASPNSIDAAADHIDALLALPNVVCAGADCDWTSFSALRRKVPIRQRCPGRLDRRLRQASQAYRLSRSTGTSRKLLSRFAGGGVEGVGCGSPLPN